jgi:hypothetical protein
MKLDAGFSQLQIEARSVQQNLTYRDPVGANKLELSLAANLAKAQKCRRSMEQAMEDEIALQGEIQRWIGGQPPSDYSPSQQAPTGGSTPWPGQQVPGATALQPGDQQTRVAVGAPPGVMPEIPPGQLDLRDPRQAAAALLRAEPLPLNPLAQGQQPQYAQVPYAPPQYVQPAQVPVQMAYADPSQAGPPNMPAAAPVQQFASPAEAQAAQSAILAGNPVHASQLNAQAVAQQSATPVNGTAKQAAKPA